MKVRHFRGNIYNVIGEAKRYKGSVRDLQELQVALMAVDSGSFSGELVPIYKMKDSKDNTLYMKENRHVIVYKSIETDEVYIRDADEFWEQGYFTDDEVIEPRFAIIIE